MARRVVRRRRRKPGPNPYYPALVAMVRGWSPVQLADAISRIDERYGAGEFEVSRDLILILSTMEQVAPQTSQTDAPGAVRLDGSIADFLGRCKLCGKLNADFITTVGGSDKAYPVCGDCYERVSNQEEDSEARRQKREAKAEAEDGDGGGNPDTGI